MVGRVHFSKFGKGFPFISNVLEAEKKELELLREQRERESQERETREVALLRLGLAGMYIYIYIN